jgi:hypothetical protein
MVPFRDLGSQTNDVKNFESRNAEELLNYSVLGVVKAGLSGSDWVKCVELDGWSTITFVYCAGFGGSGFLLCAYG